MLDLDELVYLPDDFNEKESKSVLQANDILINIVGASIGRAAVATHDVHGGNCNQAVAILRLVEGGLIPAFGVHYLVSYSAQVRIHQDKVDVARANVSLKDLRELPLPLPPQSEQRRLVSTVDFYFSTIDMLQTVADSNLSRLTRLRQSILRWAFEGRLVDQDPSDEPAAVLLERIRAEREAGGEVRRKGTRGRRANGQEKLF